ncbi:MAG: TraC family protein [Candidatus Niyogibacteria bacterium]|nr:TraC family protein [Candidatus Niyogibacteria bacterium]
MPTPTKGKAAQEFVPVREIRDGVMITDDNRMHMVLMASALNFGLRSADEQEAITAQYQNFLNALDFSVQIIIQSRHLNIEPYLETLREAERAQSNDLLKIQTREYVDFVRSFVQTSKIVSKNFYIVVTFAPPVIELGKGVRGLFGGKPGGEKHLEDAKFEEYRSQLWQRVETVSGALGSTGVRTVPLNTEELIELLYGYFNPGELEKGQAPQIHA